MQSEISSEKISQDLVGHAVEIPDEEGHGPPATWTFEADEFRQIEILERNITPTTATVTIYMATHDNPGTGEDPNAVSGKLRLKYGRRGAEWVLVDLENLSFRAIEGVSI